MGEHETPPSPNMKAVLVLFALAAVVSALPEDVVTQTHSVQVKNQIAAVTSTDRTVTSTQAFAPKAPCPPKAKEQVVQGVVQQEPVTIVHEAVPAQVGPFIKIVKETPVAPAPATVKHVPKPVPVPVPAPVAKPSACAVDVKACFASRPDVGAPSYSKGVDHWRASFSSMCAPEISAKTAAKEKKKKAEMASKELCSKNEGNQKYAERKMKLALKKEKYSKAVAEGQEKFLEKKIKSAQEAATKTIGMSKEKSKKSAERADKREDELYKKEGASKETSFKAVREAKTKVKVVYVNAVPKSVPAEPAPAPAPGKVVKTVTTIKPVPAPAPVVDKTVVYVPAPVTRTVIKTKVHHERLFKSKELTEKENSKSSELLVKENSRSQEAVDKEAAHKQHHVAVVAVKSNEGACKEKEAKAKAMEKQEEVECSLARSLCRKIYKDSTLHDDAIMKMVADHTKQMEIAWNKAQALSAKEADTTQYKICESAADDMKYFSRNFLLHGASATGETH